MFLPGLDEDHPSRLDVAGVSASLDDGEQPTRRDRYYFVGQAQVASTAQVPTSGESDRLAWVAKAKSTQVAVVPEQIAADILDDYAEDRTG